MPSDTSPTPHHPSDSRAQQEAEKAALDLVASELKLPKIAAATDVPNRPRERAQADAWQGKQVRKILVFLDEAARRSFGPTAWPNQAWTTFGVETLVCEIPDQHRAALIVAQSAQDFYPGD